jgi:predicted TPR repeat methyltransferase
VSDETFRADPEADPGGGEHDWLRTPLDDPAAVARQYDDWAQAYDVDLTSWRYDAPQVAARTAVAHRSACGHHGAVFDAGCGTGMVGAALADLGVADIDGLDVSTASIERAAGRELYRHLAAHDLTVLPYPVVDGAYDAVVCVGVMSYLPDTEAVLREFCRLVRPGGAVVLTQREDLWEPRGMEALLDRLRADGTFGSIGVTDPQPYMPGNPDFGEEIGVRYVTATVGPGRPGPTVDQT